MNGGRAVLGVAGVVLWRGVGLVELQPLSAGTAEAGAGAGAEGHDGEEGGRDDGGRFRDRGWGWGLVIEGERRRQVASVRGSV